MALMNTFQMDPCTDIILHFIRGGVPDNPIGEARNNYNAYFGHPTSTIALTEMSMGQVYSFQSSMLMRDTRSSAVGAYQFLRGTLRRLAQQANLSPGTLFTPTLQDMLGWELLVGRGYKLWWKGDMDDEGFAHLLSCEWASLPDPENGGKSHYDGDSVGNHASTTLRAVYAMLAEARAAKPK
jgi:hypothetical protein